MDLSLHIHRGARYWANEPAILYRDRTVTFRELDERSSRLANALLALGLRRGDRVAIQSRNRPELIEIECALYKAGLTKAALNPRFTATEASDVVSNCAPVAMFAGDGFLEYSVETPGFASVRHFISLAGEQPGYLAYEAMVQSGSPVAPVVDIAADDVAVLHFSSGSTGKIKAAMQTFANRKASLRKFLMSNDYLIQPGDRLAMLGPVTHATGMFIQPFLYCGASLVVFDKFDPEHFLRSVQEMKITHVFMVPAMINMILSHPSLDSYDLSSLKVLSYGAAPMAPSRIIEAWERIGPILSQGYGGAETTSGVARLTRLDHEFAIKNRPERLASCGRARGEADVRVVDAQRQEVQGDEIGEIVVRGEDVFKGYWGEPALTAEALIDGWYHTGDLAKVDDEGFIYLVDRKKDMIISGGFNVYPTEVETVLYQHPAVFEACVISIPDERWGESVKAVVSLKPGAAATAEELMHFCRSRLADYKAPRSLDFVAELPKNPSGKIARKVVREPYWQGRERRVN
jgi:acyl-CoA synthetase (AMP-forming)/AMP-acid ligase II